MTAEETKSTAARALLADDLADVLLEIGPDGRIRSVSRAVTTVWGYAPAELLARLALDLVDPADRARVLRRYVRVGRRGITQPAAPLGFRVRDRDGRPTWAEGNPAPLEDEAGRVAGWVDVLRDVEGAKAREDGVRAAQRSAEAEATAQAEFLANMSHEIRTPLNSIIGFMQVLRREGGLGEMQLGHVDRVEEAGRNLLKVVDDVLDLSKIGSGTIRLDERAFSPDALVRDGAALIRPQAAEKGLRLEVESGPGAAAMVFGDPDRLRQILLNLLSNAVKFSSRGDVRLRLDATPAGPMLDLAFIIEDDGVGIARDQLPKLFRRFTQADQTIAPRFGGTGLGLAISKRLIEAMNGSIAVESTPDVGSRFIVRVALRLAEPERVPLTAAGAAPRPGPVIADTLRDRRLLVADDIQINQRLVEALLAPLGCTVDLVADGVEALRAVQRHDYALVLMDMQMPSLDGIAATRAIRALGARFADLPIVALTGNVFPEEIERARAAGMNDVVTKPIDAERLLAAVVRWASPPAARPPETGTDARS